MATTIPSKFFRPPPFAQSMKSNSKNRFRTAAQRVISETPKKGDRFDLVVSQARVKNFLEKHPEQTNFMSQFERNKLKAAAEDANLLAAKKAQEEEAVSQMIKYYNGQARLPKYLQRERTLSEMLRDAGYPNATKFRHFGGYKKQSHKIKRQSKKKILRSHKKSKSSKNKK